MPISGASCGFDACRAVADAPRAVDGMRYEGTAALPAAVDGPHSEEDGVGPAGELSRFGRVH